MLLFNISNEINRRQEYETKPRAFSLTPGPIEGGRKEDYILHRFQVESKATPLLLSTPSRRRHKGRLHLILVPGPVERHNMLTPRPQSKATPSPLSGQIEGSQKVHNRRVFCLNRKTFIFLSFISFFPLYFHALQYGCNSVGFYLSAFLLLLYAC